MTTIVIAKYNEDISWTKNIIDSNIVIIDKSKDYENIGREAESYANFLVNNYDSLDGNYCFCQGNPFPHDKKFIKKYNSQQIPSVFGPVYKADHEGKPHYRGLQIVKYWNLLFSEAPPIEFTFVAGAQYLISSEHLKKNTFEFYQKLHEVTKLDETRMLGSAWVVERLWAYIFNISELTYKEYKKIV